MNWLKKNKNAIMCWVVILAVAPFFMEVLFFANIVGAEATVGFLILLFNEYKTNYELRKYQITQFCTSLMQVIQNHPIGQANTFCIIAISSFIAIVFTGSMTYTILVWYPIILSQL